MGQYDITQAVCIQWGTLYKIVIRQKVTAQKVADNKIIVFAEEKKEQGNKVTPRVSSGNKVTVPYKSTKVVNYTSVTDCSGDSNG